MPTKINWTSDVWNPVAAQKFQDVQCHQDRLNKPLLWTKPRMIFVNSMSDLFHEAVPDDFIDCVFAVMALAPWHTFQVLTKRPERMRDYLKARDGMGNAAICSAINALPAALGDRHGALSMPLPNVWIGVSVEDQESADKRIPILLDTPAAIRWISAEPLLGAVDIVPYIGGRAIRCGCGFNRDERFIIGAIKEGCVVCKKLIKTYPTLDWVVVGGESGPNARPMHPDWAYSIMEQCKVADVPFFFKQWGEYVSAGDPSFGTQSGKWAWIDSAGKFLDPPPDNDDADCITIKRVGKKIAGRLLGGRFFDEYPASKYLMEKPL